jgi:hypothetical protein
MPRRLHPICNSWQLYQIFQRGEYLAVTTRNFSAARSHFRLPAQLAKPECRLEVSEICLEPGFRYVIAPGTALPIAAPGVPLDAVQTQPLDPVSDRGVLGRDHAAFTGSDVLSGIERKSGRIRDRSNRPFAHGRTKRVSGILNDCNAAGSPHFRDLFYLARMAAVVHGDDCLGPGADEFLYLGRVDLHGDRVDVGEDGCRPGMLDYVRACAERQRGGDHLVACTHSQCDERQVQRRGAR